MKKWTEIFSGAAYSVEKGQVTISTRRNGGHIIALTRLYTPSTFYWTGESEKFRYYTLRKSNNGIYPIYIVSLNRQGWMIINRVRFGIIGESITVRPYTVFTDFANGSDANAIVAGLKKKGLNLSPEGDRNDEMLKNLAGTVLFLREVLAGKADIHQWQRYSRKEKQTITTKKPASTKTGNNGDDGKLDKKTTKKLSKTRKKELVA